MKNIDKLAAYDYRVYTTPEGYAVADPIDDEDGFFLTVIGHSQSSLNNLVNEAVEQLLTA